MRSTSDIQFFVCRSRIIPEPPFPSQGIAGSGNEIAAHQDEEKTGDESALGVDMTIKRALKYITCCHVNFENSTLWILIVFFLVRSKIFPLKMYLPRKMKMTSAL